MKVRRELLVRGWRRWVTGGTALAVLTTSLVLVAPAQVAQAAPCDPPITNPVLCENTKPGNPPSQWDVSGAGSASIQGFATDISVNHGQTVRFKVNTPARSYRLDIYRMGYYAGNGARLITSVNPSAALPQSQPSCREDSTTGLIDCGNWAESASWAVPADAVSGVYFAKLVRTDGTSGSSHIFFIVRDDERHSDLLFQTSDTTWQAYNTYGGNSLYVGNPAGRAYKVSYNRPITTRDTSSEDFVFNAEYPTVRWLERNGYDVSYFTGVDTARFGSLLLNHKTFMSVGHDEYWSGSQRANVEAARSAGVNLAFFSGNEIFWKTRWEPSIDGTSTPNRTLVSYKETHANQPIDPEDPPTWTGTWRDPRFSPPADGGRPENALTGQIFMANCCVDATISVPGTFRQLRFWRNTRVASLSAGGSTALTDGMLNYEWDSDLDNGSRPAGLLDMSSTTVNNASVLQDYGSSYATGTAVHKLTLYRASSGALVFGAGTVQWSWGLDSNHDRGSQAVDAAVQQATVNLLADMGSQPGSLQSGLVAATQSTDTTPPTSTITSPAGGSTVPLNSTTTISGTASDAGGGVVAGVEVSVDGGTTWHPANGTTSWTYAWTPSASNTYTIKTRAVDDSGRLETPSAGIQVTAGSGPPPPASCPCSIWSSSSAPSNPAENDGDAVEVGVKFRADRDGYITGLRFYKGSGNTGTHVGHLWTTAGSQLASVTFSSETSTGWQQADFSSPVAIKAGTTYVASYYAPAGHYAEDDGYFATSATTNGPLTALQNGTDGPNGVYRYGTGGGFPTNTWASANYWVDVVFTTSTSDTTAPTVTARTPAPDATGVPTSTSVTATFSEPVQSSTINLTLAGPNNTNVTGTQSYDATAQKVTFVPSSALTASTTYTVNLSGAKDTAGNTMAPVTWSFTTAAQDTTAPTVTARSPSAGATNVATSAAVSATFNEPVQASTIVVTLTGPNNSTVTGTQTYDSTAQRVTFTPSAALANSATYTATVSGAKDIAGNTMSSDSWSFTTVAASSSGCPCSIWPNNPTPATASVTSTRGTTLGLKFRASTSGYITGLRFYKSTNNTGQHIGKLWTRGGTELGSVTFTSETASGWQKASFAAPIPVTAGTTYVASYYAPNGRWSRNANYFTSSATTTGPLTALQSGTDGPNGVQKAGNIFPTNNASDSNYWVDVVFDTTAADTTAPTLTNRSPAAGASGVPVTTNVAGTFSEDVQPSSISFTLTGPNNTAVPAQTTYDSATRTATLTPTSNLSTATTYTATISNATDTAGNVMAPASWSFTTAASSSGCPCSIWSSSDTPATASEADSSAVELGVKFRSSTNGYVTGIRFYKGSGNTGTHVGHLWTVGGQSLGSVTFSGETSTGWQQATFSAPISVTAGTTYVASYYAPNGGYAVDNGYFSTSGKTTGPLTALQDGTDGGNGVYVYGASAFPTNTYQASNYWVDVVFDTTATDTTKPTVTQTVPAAGATDVGTGTKVSATFSESMVPSSITMTLKAPDGTTVPATTSYDINTLTETLTPNSALSYTTTYTASVSGGLDGAGNAMDPVTWSFTTAAAPPPPPDQGTGGPIAVVTSSSNPFTGYLTEMLRAEGLNEFANVPIGNVSATTLAPYDVVVLGEMPLTDTQATVFSDWVNAGGNLIAMRPDARLAALLGLTKGSGTIAEGYVKVNTATAAGAGITADTMQFHGTSDRYTLNGATSVADLYSNATTAAGIPAVTLREVGTSGGQAAAFTYDLARSTVQLHQGNPAWAGQERDHDSDSVIRSDDLYFGGTVADWVNLNKVSIPQADEQQRLLANLIEVMGRDRKPLPRFWYFPNSAKAVVVATGDDHGNNGTAGRFDTYAANSPASCSVDAWQCLRFTSYIYTSTPLSNSQASSYNNQGFEIALHPNNGCSNYTPTALENTYASQLSDWQAKYTSLPAPRTSRFHCLVWSDWFSQPRTELRHGIRFDVNYYYWPGSWIQDRPGFMTGSGIPMRFADTDGTMLDVYQSPTVMTDESGQSYPFTPDTLLDNALGSKGYYGAFTANMHTDSASTFDDDQLLASATSRGVPMVTARQMLAWTDGRNGSSFGSVSWSGSTLSFNVSVGAGATGLTGMVPMVGPGGGVLSTLTRGGSPVSFTRSTIKGIDYAMFSAAGGSYQATYGTSGGVAPAITGTTALATAPDGTATVQWSTSEPASSQVEVGTSPTALTDTVRTGGAVSSHQITLDGLSPDTTYYYRVTSTDTSGVRSVWPKRNEPAATFTTPLADERAPRVEAPQVLALPDGTATVTWSTSEPTTSRVEFGTSPDRLGGDRVDETLTTRHQLVITGLRPSRTYFYRVATTDAAGNRTVSPAPAARPLRFVTTAPGVAVHTAAQFRTGQLLGATVLDRGLGAVTIAKGHSSASYVSPVLDAQAFVPWDRASWQADMPAGTGLQVWVRTGSRATPDGSWSDWRRVPASGGQIGTHDSRFLQYRLLLTGRGDAAPVLTSIGFSHEGPPPAAENEGPRGPGVG